MKYLQYLYVVLAFPSLLTLGSPLGQNPNRRSALHDVAGSPTKQLEARSRIPPVILPSATSDPSGDGGGGATVSSGDSSEGPSRDNTTNAASSMSSTGDSDRWDDTTSTEQYVRSSSSQESSTPTAKSGPQAFSEKTPISVPRSSATRPSSDPSRDTMPQRAKSQAIDGGYTREQEQPPSTAQAAGGTIIDSNLSGSDPDSKGTTKVESDSSNTGNQSSDYISSSDGEQSKYGKAYSDDQKSKGTGSSEVKNSNNAGSDEADRLDRISTTYKGKTITCDNLHSFLPEEQWEAAGGDEALQEFLRMMDDDVLVCDECFGQTREQCKGADPVMCNHTISELGPKANGKDATWTAQAAQFARNTDVSGLNCMLGPSMCSSPPDCESCKTGLGSYAILKSLTVAKNAWQLNYDAFEQAGNAVDKLAKRFAEVYAPIPDTEGEILGLIVFTSLIAGVAGMIPDIGGAVGGIAGGIGAGLGMHQYFSSLPQSPDIASPLGLMTKKVSTAFLQITKDLFETGTAKTPSTDGKRNITISLQESMSKGALMQDDGAPERHFGALKGTYEKILFQQLAVLTWRTLEVDGKVHAPFIAFDEGPCQNVKHDEEGSLGKSVIKGIDRLHTSLDFQGDCYYLLDAYPTDQNDGAQCSGGHALPGATIESMEENKSFFNLTLDDFIIPSVLGWQNHSKSNDYKPAAEYGNIVQDPHTPGVVNLPICDYLKDAANPGVGCPKLGDVEYRSKSCTIIPPSKGENQEGQFHQGKCKLEVRQYQKNQKVHDVNRLPDYQLVLDLWDDAGIQIGSATKQRAAKPLEIANAVLPFNLMVATGQTDEDPLSFWYADQFWDSGAKDNCKEGPYDEGSRSIDCSFDCPVRGEGEDPPASATVGHPLPTPAMAAIAGPSTFTNAYIRTAGPSADVPAAPTPTYVGGQCALHLTQFQKNDKEHNPTQDYQIEVYINDGAGNPIDGAQTGKVAAPMDKPVEVKGMKAPFSVTLPGAGPDAEKRKDKNKDAADDEPMTFRFDTQVWTAKTGKDKKEAQCHVGAFDNGSRNLDCNFAC